jgi:glycosyltransferase involved in cell wall biosynthesis
MKLVSIIVPIYNTASFLPKCIESIQNQSYKNIEIILVNDGSTDNSENICKKYLESDTRVRYVSKANGGLSSARNSGIDIANGSYLSFIDSDDYIASEFISTLLNACIVNNTKLAMCGRIVVTEINETNMFTLDSPQLWNSRKALERLLTWNNIDGSVCDKLFHRSLFENQRFPLGRISEDLPVLTSILLAIISIAHVGMPMYYYLQRTESITKQKFTTHKMTVLNSAEEVRVMILEKYPELKSKADSYYYIHLFYLLNLINLDSNSSHKNEKDILIRILRQNIFSIIVNKNLRKRHKIKAAFIFFNFLNFFIANK